jgi:thiamine phosphate synthase YjbQ (UPF0047 family)
MVFTKYLSVKTKGNTEILDITDKVQAAITESALQAGIAAAL